MVWIAVYTLWNFSFTYILNKRVWAYHAAVLMAPVLLCVVYSADVWFQARAFTLALLMLIYNTFFVWFRTRFVATELHVGSVAKLLPWMSLVSAVALVLYTYYLRFH